MRARIATETNFAYSEDEIGLLSLPFVMSLLKHWRKYPPLPTILRAFVKPSESNAPSDLPPELPFAPTDNGAIVPDELLKMVEQVKSGKHTVTHQYRG